MFKPKQIIRLLKPILYAGLLLCSLISCGTYQSKTNQEANNTLSPSNIVTEHLRAVEYGNWAKADSYLAGNYKMKMEGMPFFVSIKKENALDMHRARKEAFPDFKFNEVIMDTSDNQVKIAVYLTGTHTGLLDYPKSIGVPKTEATGKKINLPAEYFIYSVENDKIVHTFGEIPDGHGPVALMKQLGIEE
jgi:predicted ester cyclase